MYSYIYIYIHMSTFCKVVCELESNTQNIKHKPNIHANIDKQ